MKYMSLDLFLVNAGKEHNHSSNKIGVACAFLASLQDQRHCYYYVQQCRVAFLSGPAVLTKFFYRSRTSIKPSS